MVRRGRPGRIDKDRIVDTILKYKDQIIHGEKIVSKCDSIWITIAKDLDNNVTPASIYTFVSCNRYKIREKLCDRLSVSLCVMDDNNKHQTSHSMGSINVTA